jgi:hypothetical protein
MYVEPDAVAIEDCSMPCIMPYACDGDDAYDPWFERLPYSRIETPAAATTSAKTASSVNMKPFIFPLL